MKNNALNNMPGFGKLSKIRDCSIGVQHSPGVVTVKFRTAKGETLLVVDPVYARILSEWLAFSAGRSEEMALEDIDIF